jgi:hypothetical protein
MRPQTALALGLVLALGSGLAMANEKDDFVMGNYQGAFSGAWAKHGIRAEVIGGAKRSFRANLFIAQDGGAEVKVALSGRGRDGKATLEGEVDLGKGAQAITASIENETMTGRVGTDGAFTLQRFFAEPPTRGAAPPEGAVVLFDGTNTDAWMRWPPAYCIQDDGSMEVCGSSMLSKQEFGDAQYHVEFRTPYMPNDIEQARGNSGFYVMGRYEVQILDSFGNEPKWDYCGGIYKVAVPLQNACLPPLQWQTYDVTMRAPRFDANGTKTENARITVVLNGVTIHDNLELPDVTPGGISGTEAPTGPIMLQDHHDSVRFRNVWVKPLND